ncbi:MAG: HAMP domain-containing histidine kinase [Candidatus Riflebacteria bacterium]|nr:HAMP domain-containing histidine kinase [Candidatus Riflebacteria bacterium]
MKSIFWQIFWGFTFFSILFFGIIFLTVALTSDFRPPPPIDDAYNHRADMILLLGIPILEKDGEVDFNKKLLAISHGPEVWRFYAEKELPKAFQPAMESLCAKDIYKERGRDRVTIIQKFYYSQGKSGFLMFEGPVIVGLIESFLADKLFFFRLLIVLSVALFLCYRLSRTIINPLINLRDTSFRLGTNDLSARTSEQLTVREDEIGDLARGFNRMAENLEILVSSQKKLFHEISHEFKSPLTRLQLSIESIEMTDPEKYSEEISRIKLECHRIKSLVDQILAVAKIDAGLMGPKESFRIDHLLNDLLADLQIEADNKRINLVFKNRTSLQCVSHPLLFRRACESVLRNSIKYSPQNSEINISLSLQQVDGISKFWIVFKDQRPGVPEDKIAELLVPFSSGSVEFGSESPGLGLSIVNRIVRKLNGSVSLRNADPKGFQIELYFSQ